MTQLRDAGIGEYAAFHDTDTENSLFLDQHYKKPWLVAESVVYKEDTAIE